MICDIFVFQISLSKESNRSRHKDDIFDSLEGLDFRCEWNFLETVMTFLLFYRFKSSNFFARDIFLESDFFFSEDDVLFFISTTYYFPEHWESLIFK